MSSSDHLIFVTVGLFFMGFVTFGLMTSPFGSSHFLVFSSLLFLILAGLGQFFPRYEVKVFSNLEKINIISATLVGGVITYLLINELKLNPVIASSVVGLVGYGLALVVTKAPYLDLAPMVYCGSFVGMVAQSRFNEIHTVVASIVAGIIFIVLASRFNGCGGKLGSIAFMSCTIVFFIVEILGT